MERLPAREVHVWSAGLNLPPARLARLQATLSAGERRRAEVFRCARDRRRFVAAHGVLREILACYLETRPEHIAYVRNACGKPGLAPGYPGRLEFNLAHTAELALVAVAAGGELGVDVESLRAGTDDMLIARCFFSPAEVARLAAVPETSRATAFLGCWTKKEACLKACGAGLTLPLSAFSVPPGNGRVAIAGFPAKCWSVYTLRPARGYLGALAIAGQGWVLRHGCWHGGGGRAAKGGSRENAFPADLQFFRTARFVGEEND